LTSQPSNPSRPDALAPRRSPGRTATVLIALALLLLLCALLRLWVGSSVIGWPTSDVLMIRLNRLTLALIVGVALSISGVALQALLRNALAEPYILGLSTGAGAGIMAQSLVLYYMGITFGASYIGALVGAGASVAIVFLASRRRGMLDPLGLLLTGVVLSTINGAIIMMLNYLVGPGGIRDDLARWMMGFLNEGVGRQAISVVAVLTVAGFIALLSSARAMDVATFSDTEAQSLGVHLGRLRTTLFIVASVLSAGAVVVAGPIAFVGLICPHLARVLLGPAHRPLLVGSALVGAIMILLADVLSELLALRYGFGRMPIGIFTAMVGGPVFLWMLHPQLGRGAE
jgi:iron complex transport system permease protein